MQSDLCTITVPDAPLVGISERLFLGDTIAAAYHLALLERPYSDHVLWKVHRGPAGQLDAAAAFYSLRRPTVIFLLGDRHGIDACLASARLPEVAYIAYFQQHSNAVCGHYEQVQPALMHRMALARASFFAAGALMPASCEQPAVLGPDDLPALEALYRLEAGFHPDMHQFNSGRYVGIRRGRIIVAAAGTHFISESPSFAMIGNVATHPDHRGRGYGRAVVLGLLQRLFETTQCVCLNVRQDNEAAVKLYQTLGFSTHGMYCESVCSARENAPNARFKALQGTAAK